MTPGSSQSQPTGQPAWRIKTLQPKGYISVRTQFNNVCTFYEMCVAICTLNISYTNPWYTGLYIVCTCLYDSKRVYKCIYMYIHVWRLWTMYIHVYTSECTYHVRTMYRRVYTFAEMYKLVHTCIHILRNVYTMYVSGRTIASYIRCTYMVQTYLYTFMLGGQGSRCRIQIEPGGPGLRNSWGLIADLSGPNSISNWLAWFLLQKLLV